MEDKQDPPHRSEAVGENKLQVSWTVSGILLGAYLAIGGLLATLVPHWGWVVFICLWALALSIAAIAVFSPRYSTSVMQHLSVTAYQPLYKLTMRRLIRWEMRLLQLGPPDFKRRSAREIFSEIARYPLLDRAILFAVVYPILALIVHWGLLPEAGSEGGVYMMPRADAVWKHHAAVFGLVIVASTWLYTRRAKQNAHAVSQFLSGFAPFGVGIAFALLASEIGLPMSFILAVAVAVAFAVTASGPFALLGASAFSISGVAGSGLSSLLSGVFILAGSFSLAIAVANLADVWAKTERTRPAIGLVLIAQISLLASALIFFPWPTVASSGLGVFLFLGVLPIFNGSIDAVSYLITLFLSRLGLHRNPLFCGFLDTVAALVLFLILGTVLVVIVSMINRAAGVEFANLGVLLAQAEDVEKYSWLYVMLFSTALPTAIHCAVACFSLQAIVAPTQLREWISRQVVATRTGDIGVAFVATFSLGTMWLFSFLVGFAVVLAIGWMIWTWFLHSFLLVYRDWLIDVAIWAGGI